MHYHGVKYIIFVIKWKLILVWYVAAQRLAPIVNSILTVQIQYHIGFVTKNYKK
jgi:hypothetical protein